MNLRYAAVVSVLLGLAIPSPGRAASIPWVGTLHLEFVSLEPVAFTGSGVATLNGSGGGVHLSALRLAGGITGTATIPLSDPETATLVSLQASVILGTGTFSPFTPVAPPGQPQLTQRTLPVRGAVKLCILFPGCGNYLPVPLTVNQGATGVGVGGLLTAGGFAKGGGPAVSMQGAPWTIGIASLPIPTGGGGSVTLTATGWVHGPVTFTSSTALTGGSVSLVTPVQVISDAGQALSMFVRLTVRFVPEPGLLLLLGSGVSALAVLGRGRMRP